MDLPKLCTETRPGWATHRACAVLAMGLVVGLGGALPAHGQEAPKPDAPPEPAAEAPAPEAPPSAEDLSRPMGPSDPFNRGTPRGSVYGYLVAARMGDYEKAAEFLDLRGLEPEDAERGAELARQLKVILDRKLWIDFDTLSDSNDGYSDDGLAAWQDRLGQVDTKQGRTDLLLQRVAREGDGVRIWKISSATVAAIDELHDQFGPVLIERFLPKLLFKRQILNLWLWQWCGLALVLLLAWGFSRVLAIGLIRVLHHYFAGDSGRLDGRIVSAVRGPVRLLTGMLVFSLGTLALELPIQASESLRTPVWMLFIVAITWLVMRGTDIGTLVARQRLLASGQSGLIPVLVPSQRIARGLILAFGGLAVLSAAGVNVTAAVAGLGVGGIAVALAAQKSIENLFGGVTLFADQPVRVGDYFRFGDQTGTVEEIGLRSTRVRTLDRTVVSIPNAELSSLQLENFAKRDRMRLNTILGVRYETTSDQLRYLLARLRELLLAHPRITEDPARVRFVGFGAYSLDIEIFCYVETRDWNDFLAVREDLYLRIIDVVNESGSGFAFPSSTMYVAPDTGLPEKQARDAEEQVRTWRREGALPFPQFPDGFASEKRNRLDWPPAGSPGSPRSEGGGAGSD